RRSLITIRSTLVSSSVKTFFSRSWVMGRGVVTFSISIAMALASKMPTQIGRKTPSAASRRMTTGMWETGSIKSPLISIFSIGAAGCGLRQQGVGKTPGDADRQIVPGLRRFGCVLDVHDAVAGGAAGRLPAPVPAFDEDLQLFPDEATVDLDLNLLLQGQES